MREILFRGKRLDNGEWVVGNLFIPDKFANREPPTEILVGTNIVRISYEVDPATVGQYTGLTDKNGKKIFEGDIIKIPDNYDEFGRNAGEIYEIYFCCGGFRLNPKYSQARGYWLEDDRTVEVIGNIHDDKELLNVEEEIIEDCESCKISWD